MTKTLVAMFDDIAVAQQVVEDLVNADFPRDTISLVRNDPNHHYTAALDHNRVQNVDTDVVSALEGATFGAAVGVLTGMLVGAVALTIPGIGIAIVAGPIVAGLTGVVAGAVTGGIIGALVKSGVPEDEAHHYAEGIRRGATLITIKTTEVRRAEAILKRDGAVDIYERANTWHQDGWQGFDANRDTDSDADPTDNQNSEDVFPVTFGAPLNANDIPTTPLTTDSRPDAPPIPVTDEDVTPEMLKQ
ncbi:MAG: hypothetical protein ACOYL5_01430 [Phototrophicaceae bacterium]|jgi:uncharacterized membrane protein